MSNNLSLVSSVETGFQKYLREINAIPCLSKEEEFSGMAMEVMSGRIKLPHA